MKLYYLIIPIFFFILGFQVIDTSGVFERPAFRTRYVEKMNKFHLAQELQCQEEAITIARAQVDSVLTGKKLLVEKDSFELLPKPEKPQHPEFDFEIDSLSPDPIFDKD